MKKRRYLLVTVALIIAAIATGCWLWLVTRPHGRIFYDRVLVGMTLDQAERLMPSAATCRLDELVDGRGHLTQWEVLNEGELRPHTLWFARRWCWQDGEIVLYFAETDGRLLQKYYFAYRPSWSQWWAERFKRP